MKIKPVPAAILSALAAFGSASAHSAMLYSDVAYGQANATAAEANFLGMSNGSFQTETFDGSLGFVNSIGAAYGSGDQNRWLNAADAIVSSVGTIAMTTPEVGSGGDDNASDKLMLEDDSTGEFGRQTGYQSRWIDSNDADKVTWTIDSNLLPNANAFGFYLSDANDQGASLKLIFDDGTQHVEQLNSPLSNGNLMYVSFIVDSAINSATLEFDNGSYQNDGWGLDNLTIATIPVPEPGTLALLSLGLIGLGGARYRRS